ncbi:MAG: PorT family protein [Rhodothermales bacterium]
MTDRHTSGAVRRAALLLAAITMLVFMPQRADAQLGVAAGLNFESLTDISGSRSATYDNASGYHFGVFFDTDSSPLALRLGAYYRDMGEVELDLGEFGQAFDLSLLDVALDVRFAVLPLPLVKAFVSAGPVVSFPSSSNDEYKESLQSTTVSGNVGGGLAISLGGLTLIPELRYSIGVSRFMKDEFSIRGIEFVTDDVQRSNSVMLRLGIVL